MNDTVSERAKAILDGDRRELARAITLVESTRSDHHRQAEELIDELLPHTGGALRIGITGPPGVGKSTFIDTFGRLVVEQGHRLAVLAVDPSSSSGRGSILGDKTRMASLAGRDDVFIRPSPSGGALGGIGRRTRDAIALCEAAGYDLIMVETVGVGQSETTVATVTDLFLLLVSPGGGDDLQGIKRGVMELADLVAVNKADGHLAPMAEQTAGHYRLALHLVRPTRPGTETPVLTCSSTSGDGIDEVWATLGHLHQRLAADGTLDTLRADQAVAQLTDELRSALYARAEADDEFAERHRNLERSVIERDLSVSAAARELIDLIFDGDEPS
ncbi:MAG: methylmalonyl Co-A mutase-associated GTPase MeaB [Actinomycetota bacterium]